MYSAALTEQDRLHDPLLSHSWLVSVAAISASEGKSTGCKRCNYSQDCPICTEVRQDIFGEKLLSLMMQIINLSLQNANEAERKVRSDYKEMWMWESVGV